MKNNGLIALCLLALLPVTVMARQDYFPIGEFGAWPSCDFRTWARGADTCNINTIYLVGYSPSQLQSRLAVLKGIGQKAMLGNCYTGASTPANSRHNLERLSGGVYDYFC